MNHPLATRVEVTPEALRLLPEVDYADAFLIATPRFHSAERWARSAFEDASAADFVAMQTTWRLLLGLRLGRLGSAERIGGWQVVENEPGRLVLQATSWQMAGRVVFDVNDAGATVTTLAHFRRPPARALWGVVGPAHRRAVPRILAAARKRLEC